MSELINREELLDLLNKCLAELGGLNMIVDTTLMAIKNAVEEMPTVDAVPVIRCKDCRFCRKYKYRENVCTCLRLGSGRNMYDYCSYAQIKEANFGERRNDDCN